MIVIILQFPTENLARFTLEYFDCMFERQEFKAGTCLLLTIQAPRALAGDDSRFQDRYLAGPLSEESRNLAVIEGMACSQDRRRALTPPRLRSMFLHQYELQYSSTCRGD